MISDMGKAHEYFFSHAENSAVRLTREYIWGGRFMRYELDILGSEAAEQLLNLLMNVDFKTVTIRCSRRKELVLEHSDMPKVDTVTKIKYYLGKSKKGSFELEL